MKKRMLKRIALVVYCSFVISILTTVAIGAIAYGSWGYYSQNGYDYRSRNTIEIFNRHVKGFTMVGPSGNQTIPVGYAKVQCTIVNRATGKFLDQTPLYTNSQTIQPGYVIQQWIEDLNAAATTTFYTHGQTQAYNPYVAGGYVIYASLQSPDQTTTR